MSEDHCLFCRIVAGHEKSWTIWMDDDHVAVLTPFPNTRGFTVVLPRRHLPSYVFELDDDAYAKLLGVARRVGRLLDRALGTRRTALIAEGMGIDHAHVKLMPLHGVPEGPWRPHLAPQKIFYDRYEGFVSSHDGPRASDAELDEVERIIRTALIKS